MTISANKRVLKQHFSRLRGGIRDTTHSTHPCWVRERPYHTHTRPRGCRKYPATSALTSLVCAAFFSNPMCWMLLNVQYSLYLSLSYHIETSWYQRWRLHLVIKPRSRSALIYILSWQRVHSNHYNISTQPRWPNIGQTLGRCVVFGGY